jgi:transcriptional regulator
MMVLAVVEDRPRHGYDIARRIDQTSGGLLRFHVASLYPMLYRMEQKGWIQGRWIEKAGQRRRRYYRLTPAGRRVLAAQRREWQSLVSALDRVAKISTG